MCSWRHTPFRKSYSHTGGYLKAFDYKEAFTKSVTEASKEDRDLIRALPNFNADIFVHGDIRHLEIRKSYEAIAITVHGDIRHLEKCANSLDSLVFVHGDIRHLETVHSQTLLSKNVHGDIRHLEMCFCCFTCFFAVHGDIRHLEI